MSYNATTWALQQEICDPVAKLILVTICDYVNRAGNAWPSIKTIADCICRDERTVQRKLRILKDIKLIKITARKAQNGRQKSNLYEPNFDRILNSELIIKKEKSAQDVNKNMGDNDDVHDNSVAVDPDKDVTGAPDNYVTPITLNKLFRTNKKINKKNYQDKLDLGYEDSDEISARELADVCFEDRFNDFWMIYPKKIAKVKARQIYKRLTKSNDEIHDHILASLKKYVSEINFKKQSGKFAPEFAHATTWLNQQRWLDYDYNPNSTEYPQEFIDRINNFRKLSISPDETLKFANSISRQYNLPEMINLPMEITNEAI